MHISSSGTSFVSVPVNTLRFHAAQFARSTNRAIQERRRILSAVVHHGTVPIKKETTKKPNPQPGEPGHRFFEFSPEQVDALRIRHILVETQEMCDELFKTLSLERKLLSNLASTLSKCGASKVRNGDLGWWRQDDLLPSDVPLALVDDSLLTAALNARLNHLERVQSMHGWHLFVVEEVRHKLQVAHSRAPVWNNPNRYSQKASIDNVQPPLPQTFSLQTLGCQMNKSDSERMAGHLERMGYRAIDDPFRASVLVLNTCNIREHAETKVYSYIGRHVARKRRFPADVTLAVAGCVAQQEGERMLRRVPELDLVFGPQYANRLDELLDEIARNGCQVAATDPTHITEDIATPRRESSVTAWVNVIYGCGENCTFCTVGNVVRTVEQSRNMEAIRSEIERVAQAGIREVVLLGQNIDAYGRDIFPKRTFSELLRFVHDVDGIDRIRFTTSHPRYISEGLIQTCAEFPKIMPFFHIPPQSGDNGILKAMRRGYSVETFIKIVERIRKYIPNAAIGGDMIVGFPGEGETEFLNSIKLLNTIKFDIMNTASYSPRPKTPAAEYENQVSEDVKHERLLRMNDVVKEHALERSMQYIGRTEEVLVEEQNPKNLTQVIGRTPTYRTVYFPGSIDLLRGKLVPVKILNAFPFSLQGEQNGKPI